MSRFFLPGPVSSFSRSALLLGKVGLALGFPFFLADVVRGALVRTLTSTLEVFETRVRRDREHRLRLALDAHHVDRVEVRHEHGRRRGEGPEKRDLVELLVRRDAADARLDHLPVGRREDALLHGDPRYLLGLGRRRVGCFGHLGHHGHHPLLVLPRLRAALVPGVLGRLIEDVAKGAFEDAGASLVARARAAVLLDGVPVGLERQRAGRLLGEDVAEVPGRAVLANGRLAEGLHRALVEDAGVLGLGVVGALEHDHRRVHVDRRDEANVGAAKATRVVAVVMVGLPNAAVLGRRVVLEREHRQPRRAAAPGRAERADSRLRVFGPGLVVPSLAWPALGPGSPAVTLRDRAFRLHVAPGRTIRRERRALLAREVRDARAVRQHHWLADGLLRRVHVVVHVDPHLGDAVVSPTVPEVRKLGLVTLRSRRRFGVARRPSVAEIAVGQRVLNVVRAHRHGRRRAAGAEAVILLRHDDLVVGLLHLLHVLLHGHHNDASSDCLRLIAARRQRTSDDHRLLLVSDVELHLRNGHVLVQRDGLGAGLSDEGAGARLRIASLFLDALLGRRALLPAAGGLHQDRTGPDLLSASALLAARPLRGPFADLAIDRAYREVRARQVHTLGRAARQAVVLWLHRDLPRLGVGALSAGRRAVPSCPLAHHAVHRAALEARARGRVLVELRASGARVLRVHGDRAGALAPALLATLHRARGPVAPVPSPHSTEHGV